MRIGRLLLCTRCPKKQPRQREKDDPELGLASGVTGASKVILAPEKAGLYYCSDRRASSVIRDLLTRVGRSMTVVEGKQNQRNLMLPCGREGAPVTVLGLIPQLVFRKSLR